MQPFERHPARLGELETCGSQLLTQAANAIENGDLTRRAYQPAIDSWDGMGAPELAAARDPVQSDCEGASHALAWASVVAQYWAGQVRAFNSVVDSIDTSPDYGASGVDGGPPSDAQIATARAAAQQQWWDAYHMQILDGGDRAAAMLRDGPTQEHIAELREVGLLAGADGLLPAVGHNIAGQYVPPVGGSWLDWALWGGGHTATLAVMGSELAMLRYERWYRPHWRQLSGSRWRRPAGPVPRSIQVRGYARGYLQPHWRDGLRLGDQRVTMGTYRYYRMHQQMRPGLGQNPAARAARDSLGRNTRWLGRGGAALSIGTATWDQWNRDTGRTDIDGTERVARAATRGVTVGGAAWAGAKGGAIAGAAIGSVLPGVGTTVGGVVGGIVGGIAGATIASGVASGVVDEVVDGVGNAAEAVGDFVGGLR
jgi:hypothetical protein